MSLLFNTEEIPGNYANDCGSIVEWIYLATAEKHESVSAACKEAKEFFETFPAFRDLIPVVALPRDISKPER
ncbi:MAG: hypothetical protein GY868_10440 [Deltaproteobacteria bacterium]|nr:hypothetical protein [Deltaproteobacteria bacterium]